MTHIMDKVFDNLHAKNTADTEENDKVIDLGRKSEVKKDGSGGGSDCKCLK